MEIKKLVGRSTARKSPIGSTNNQWGGTKPPLIKVSLYVIQVFIHVYCIKLCGERKYFRGNCRSIVSIYKLSV
ncbi:hypothetical protein BTO25_03500 [Bacillus sp. MB366]|uniref:Uncharacterized protein n=2 Tax=Bacillus cereus group TaxID=86661 RepID=A0A9X6B3E2_BACCE|nr:hypothetical protein F8158_14675 [Bacillus cereus]OLR83881.1 hypothetical protein BTO25_03500 [Bacillus sp. MB366]OTZ37435.1 hypothetical protein BK761_02640 [Bacillus thuringiensis serovar darmstadiensis]OUA50641.1 hypothetical protein BK785_29470 [Bacillus thuringiensis serovar bolivia]OUA73732.1 hypothetical protein BK787_22270 [Bacillus thuringiensis serovar pahangi]PPI92025.1 hypothetical protein C4J69_15940 [Escherichia coli]